ncbi:MAG: metallophosphoesterase [Candidatus Nanopelagicales bacterium]
MTDVGPTLRIAHVSDTHVGAHDERALGGLADELHAAGVAATILTGDLTMRARTRQFVRAKEVIDRFPAPTMVVLGNHDVPLTNLLGRMTSPYAKYRNSVSEDLDPVLDLAGARIQGLGSMPRWRWKSGRVSERQAGLVETTFADSPLGSARIVALHHPPSSGNLEALAGGGRFERAMVEAEVDVILAGHTHVPSVTALTVGSGSRTRTILEVVAGTATSHRTRGVARSWSLLEISPRTLTVTEYFADSSGWRAADPHSHQLARGAHRPS